MKFRHHRKVKIERPYQAATGTLLPGGRLDWFTAEALLSLAWAALYLPCGIAAYKMIGRSYRA